MLQDPELLSSQIVSVSPKPEVVHTIVPMANEVHTISLEDLLEGPKKTTNTEKYA